MCASLHASECSRFILAKPMFHFSIEKNYAICLHEIVIGLVIIRVYPTELRPYAFTELFIADEFQKQGFGKQAVEVILDKFRNEKKSKLVRIEVHQDNSIAIGIYKKCGFAEVKRAEWNHDFLVMELVL